MPLLRAKQQSTYLFIFYRSAPPTSEQQAQIVASISKGKTQTTPRLLWRSKVPAIAFAMARQLTEEQWRNPAALREAELNALCAMYLAKEGFPAISLHNEPVYKTHEMMGFLITTVSEDID